MGNPFEDLRQAVVVRPMNSPGPQGAAAPELKIQYSNEGTSWHNDPLETDRYLRFSTDNGVSWSDAIYFNNLSETLEWVEKARQWAENPENVEVEPGKFSSLHWAAKARESGQVAEDFALYASQSAVQAEQSADNATFVLNVSPWDSTATYQYPDVVSYIDGHTYRCVSQTPTSEIPNESDDWVRISYFPANIIEDNGSYPSIMKNSVILNGTLWINSRFGITWKDAGYITIFKTFLKTPYYDSLYLKQGDPDMLGDLVIQNSTTFKHDKKKDRFNIYISGIPETVSYDADPIYVNGDTCGAISLVSGVDLFVETGNFRISVLGVTESTPPDIFDVNASQEEIAHVGASVMKTSFEFIEEENSTLSFGSNGVYANEFIEDESVSYFVASPSAIRTPLMVEVG